jgi:predicted lipoprotein with Yx(FWY)xxD motif
MKQISHCAISKMPISVWSLLVICLFILSACQPMVIATPEFPTVAPALSTLAPPQVTAPGNPDLMDIGVGYVPRWGAVLVDGNEMTLYVSTFDPPDRSNCDTNCMKIWQPLLTKDNLELGEGVDSALLGTGTLPDGTQVVTYGHWPLYRYALDIKPGDNQGQGYYDSWFMISPEGEVLQSRE